MANNKVFISWSGDRSHRVAELLNTWIQCALQKIDPWLSSKDIDRGSLWFSEIMTELASTNVGIICLTKSNKDNPWMLFEAGALAKGVGSSRIYTFLIDLEPKDIKDPLAQFNHTKADKAGVYQLVHSINANLKKKSLKEEILLTILDKYWPDFEKDFAAILQDTPIEDITEERPPDDMMSEILYTIRDLSKEVQNLKKDIYNEELDLLKRELRDYRQMTHMLKQKTHDLMVEKEEYRNMIKNY